MKVDGKVAIVTGASGGIGLSTARLLAAKGAKVALIARSEAKLKAISSKIPGSIYLVCDMSNPEQIKVMVSKVYEHFGQIDILVNNAGRGYDSTIEHSDPNILEDIFKLDFVGPLVAMQQVIPVMSLQNESSIVNVSSGTALMHLPNMGGYAAIKAALAHLSLTANGELKNKGIAVSVVYPYSSTTDFETNTIRGRIDSQLFASDDPKGFSLPPPDTPEYVAGLILKAIKTGKPEMAAHDWMNR